MEEAKPGVKRSVCLEIPLGISNIVSFIRRMSYHMTTKLQWCYKEYGVVL